MLIVLIVIGVVAECAMLALVIRSENMYSQLPAKKADAVIVLGARVDPDGSLSTQLRYRVERAREVYEAGLADYIIVCGAQGSDEPTTEAAAMAGYLEAGRVPPEAILREDGSYSTVENLENAMHIMEELGLETAIICTSEYHVQRALWTARQMGLDAQGVGSQASDYPALLWQSRLRETASWVKYHLIDRWRI